MKEIQLSKQGKNRGKYVALVDDEDFEYLNQFRWCVYVGTNTVYALRKIKINNSKFIGYRMHCDIMGKEEIDHIDHDGLNNQKYNLRICTHGQNMMNRRPNKNTSSKYKGVSWCSKSNKWLSQIIINKTRYHLRYFDDEVEAAKVYDEKAKELFKEFAYLNFP